MAWSTPLTAVANAVLLASQWNDNVRDNMLETMPAKATGPGNLFFKTDDNEIGERAVKGDSVIQQQSTSSTTYTDLATIGPRVILDEGETNRVLLFMSCMMIFDTINVTGYASFEIETDGVITSAANDGAGVIYQSDAADGMARLGVFQQVTTGLDEPGTIRMKYRVGTANTVVFSARHLTVIQVA